ncbi:MAG TPA: tetratricopeptide repeat protein [Chitinophagaceae bacterium]|jgi:tetratricopeptide (TPR) repeat protein|nr:tetratricopeptide repeat protein [Chitinophagaceae bacterium]
MRKFILPFLFAAISNMSVAQKQHCENKQYPAPAITDSLKKVFEANLRSAEKKYKADSLNDEQIIWYGRRLAYLGNYNEAIAIFTKGINLHPGNARFYRHRAHRYITLRCYDNAIADLKKAIDLIKDQIDEIEEDGIPNARNFPTSTLHTNIYYHLGLAYYLKGDNKQALLAWEKCLDISDNDDMKVATLNWLNIVLRKMGRQKDAELHLKEVTGEMEIIENRDYYDILLMYKSGDDGKLVEKTQHQQTISNATLSFALGTYYQLKGDKGKARELFEKVVAGNQWSSFGYIAAESELAKMK